MHQNVKSADIYVCMRNHGQFGLCVAADAQRVVFIIRIRNIADCFVSGTCCNHNQCCIRNSFHLIIHLLVFLIFICNLCFGHFRWPDDGLSTMKAAFRLEIISSKMRHRRDVIFSFADFVGSFGGAAALFLGGNIWHLAVVCLKIGEKLIQVFWHREQTY